MRATLAYDKLPEVGIMTSAQTAESCIIDMVCKCHLPGDDAKTGVAKSQKHFVSTASWLPLMRHLCGVRAAAILGNKTWLQQCSGPWTAVDTLKVAPYLPHTAP